MYTVEVSARELEAVKQRYLVTGILNTGSTANVKIISQEPPFAGAKLCDGDVEDASEEAPPPSPGKSPPPCSRPRYSHRWPQYPEERVRFRNLLCEIARDRIVLLSTHIVGDIEATCENIAVLIYKQSPNHLEPYPFYDLRFPCPVLFLTRPFLCPFQIPWRA